MTQPLAHADTRHVVVSEHGVAVDVNEAMAQIEKGQQLAGHFPDADALGLARRVLIGELTAEQAHAEADAIIAR